MAMPLQLVTCTLRCGYVKIKSHALIALSVSSVTAWVQCSTLQLITSVLSFQRGLYRKELKSQLDAATNLTAQAHTIISEEHQPILIDSPHSTEMESIFWQTASCIKCDSMGAVFHSSAHDFRIVIPEGAVPKGVVISIEI